MPRKKAQPEKDIGNGQAPLISGCAFKTKAFQVEAERMERLLPVMGDAMAIEIIESIE